MTDRADELELRRLALDHMLAAEALDAALVIDQAGVRYFTGFTGSAGYMRSTMIRPNSEHETLLAPSIRRAKS